jgi:hypothetical protein
MLAEPNGVLAEYKLCTRTSKVFAAKAFFSAKVRRHKPLTWHGVIPGDQAAYLSFLLDAYVDCEMDDGKVASFRDVARVIADTADSLEVPYLPQRCAWWPPWQLRLWLSAPHLFSPWIARRFVIR